MKLLLVTLLVFGCGDIASHSVSTSEDGDNDREIASTDNVDQQHNLQTNEHDPPDDCSDFYRDLYVFKRIRHTLEVVGFHIIQRCRILINTFSESSGEGIDFISVIDIAGCGWDGPYPIDRELSFTSDALIFTASSSESSSCKPIERAVAIIKNDINSMKKRFVTYRAVCKELVEKIVTTVDYPMTGSRRAVISSYSEQMSSYSDMRVERGYCKVHDGHLLPFVDD